MINNSNEQNVKHLDKIIWNMIKERKHSFKFDTVKENLIFIFKYCQFDILYSMLNDKRWRHKTVLHNMNDPFHFNPIT